MRTREAASAATNARWARGWTWSWTAIWTVLAFLLLLFHGDSILAFAAEQLRARRLDLQREKTRQAMPAQQRDPLV